MTVMFETSVALKNMLDEHSRAEKHIGYHILPEYFNSALRGSEFENQYTFFERERFSFFKQHIDFNGKQVIDIGCNIGYFIFSIIDEGAKNVVGYEGKSSCVNFIREALSYHKEALKFEVYNQYFDFKDVDRKFDVGLLLNVIHHLGDDFGETTLSIERAKAQMIEHLRSLSKKVDTLVFQMGFNWKGDRNKCLFEHGSKAEMIDFLCEGLKGLWEISAIGVAEKNEAGVSYQPLSEKNIQRDDSLGEFLNRPIFILKSIG